jgi:hypothetical protein
VEAQARFERDAWLGWVSRTSQSLAAAFGVDPAALFGALDKAVREHLTDLSHVKGASVVADGEK